MTPKLPADFTCNLYSHAMADSLWPELRLRDIAARELWERLSIGRHPRARKTQVACSRWFDLRCRDFIGRYPQAEFIALEPGLHTRFHRLSQQTDWPRFRWCDLDRPERAQCKQQLLPTVDNYRIIPLDSDRLCQQLGDLTGASRMPLMVLCEAPDKHFHLPQWQNILQALHQAAEQRPVELLYDCPNRLRAQLSHPLSPHPLHSGAALTDAAQLICQEPLCQGLQHLIPGRRFGFHLRLAPRPGP